MSRLRLAALAAALALAGGCASRVDQAREACASYGLAGDPYCLMYVGEARRQRSATVAAGALGD